MINLKITESSKSSLYAELENKFNGIRELSSSQTNNYLLTAAYSISALKFIKETNLLARSAKKSFHHVYEWNSIGKENGRLFRIVKKQGMSSSATIYYKFNNSKIKSPISPELQIPGKTGRKVTKSGIFKRKADVMESGKPISFITNKHIAFSPKGGGIVFIPPGKTINIKNPGGEATTGSFENHFTAWWKINFQNALDSKNIPSNLESNVAAELSRNGTGQNAVKATVRKILAPHLIVGSII